MSNATTYVMRSRPTAQKPPGVEPPAHRTLKRDIAVVACSLLTGVLVSWGFGLSSAKPAPATPRAQTVQPSASAGTAADALRATIREELARLPAAAPTRSPHIVAENTAIAGGDEQTKDEQAAKAAPTETQRKALTELETRIDQRMTAGVWRVEDEEQWRKDSALLRPEDEFELRRRLAVAWNEGSMRREYPERQKLDPDHLP